MIKNQGRFVLVLAALGSFPLAAFGDEIVHFTNGAEMTVRAHTVENEKSMLRLDLGENNSIAFPMSMVDKIVNAGQDVYLNPTFHPSNQAISGPPGSMMADTTLHGSSGPVGNVRQSADGDKAGVRLGEAADQLPASMRGSAQIDQTVASSRRVFNPAYQPKPGAQPQVIMPPNMAKATVTQMVMLPVRPAERQPPPSDTPADQPPPTPAPEDPPDNQ